MRTIITIAVKRQSIVTLFGNQRSTEEVLNDLQSFLGGDHSLFKVQVDVGSLNIEREPDQPEQGLTGIGGYKAEFTNSQLLGCKVAGKTIPHLIGNAEEALAGWEENEDKSS